MDSPSIMFGTDGWHAAADEMFTDANVIRVAHAFVRYRSAAARSGDGPIAIAFDGRRASHHSASLFADVVSSHGVRVLLSHAIIPTPVLSFAVTHRVCAAGVMVTGGSSAPGANGIRFKSGDGGPLSPGETKKIEECIRPADEPYVPQPLLVERADFLPDYIAHMRMLVNFDALRSFGDDPRNHAAVMIDSMGGAGQTLLEDLLTPCGWRAQTIFGTADPGFYDRTPDARAQHLQPLSYNVSVTDTLFGIATDGDAGGCGLVYDDGEAVSAKDAILALAWHLRENKKWTGGIIAPAPVSDMLRRLAEDWGVPVVETPAGFTAITEALRGAPSMVGADGNGGFAYGPHIPDRDGILSGLFFAEMIAHSGRSLHDIISALRRRVGPPQPRV